MTFQSIQNLLIYRRFSLTVFLISVIEAAAFEATMISRKRSTLVLPGPFPVGLLSARTVPMSNKYVHAVCPYVTVFFLWVPSHEGPQEEGPQGLHDPEATAAPMEIYFYYTVRCCPAGRTQRRHHRSGSPFVEPFF